MGSMNIRIITAPIAIDEVDKMAKGQFGELIKAAVDIKKQIIALGGDLHADEEQLLLETGSDQADLWGINLYPAKFGQPDFIEFDSMINLRPSQNNVSRGIDSPAIQNQVKKVVQKLVIKAK